MAGPWEKYAAPAASGPWDKYGAAPPAPAAAKPERTFLDSVKDAGNTFWDWTGKPVALALGMGSGTDSERAAQMRDAQAQIVKGVMNEPARVRQELTNALDAFVAGNPRATMHHVLTAIPGIGEGTSQAAQAFDRGEYAKGVGITGALLAPAVVKEAPALVEGAKTAAKAGVSATGEIVGDLVPNSVKQAVSLGKEIAGGSSAIDFATSPITRDLVGVASPRLKNTLSAVARARDAVRERMGPPEVPAAEATPGQLLARESGQDWAKLSPDDRGILESVAKAKANAAEQPARPPMGPPQAPAPTVEAQAPAAPPQSLADMLKAEMAAQRAAEAPAPAPAPVEPGPPVTKPRRNAPQKLPEGAVRVPTPLGTTGTPPGTMPPPRPPASLSEVASPAVEAPQVAPQPSPAPMGSESLPTPPAPEIPAPTSRTVEVPTRGEVPGTVKWMTEDGLQEYVKEHGMEPDAARAALTANGYEIVSRGKLNRAIHGAGNQLGLGHGAVSDIAAMDYGVKSMTQLTQDQLMQMYERLQDRQGTKAPAAPKSAPTAAALDGMSIPELRKALDLPASASPAEVRAAKVKIISEQLNKSLEGK